MKKDTHNNFIKYGSLIIAILNAVAAFLLSIVNYLKLDAASEAHKISSHQYDKLQTQVEFLSGNSLLFSEASVLKHRNKIIESRVLSTNIIYNSLIDLQINLKGIISASAIGYYPDTYEYYDEYNL